MAESLPNVTKVGDVIEPEIFTQYTIDTLAERSEIVYSGAVANDAELNRLISGGGTILTMPRWGDLTGEARVMTDAADLEPSGISAKAELATVLLREKAWGSSDLAAALAGSDPMTAMASRVVDYWARQERNTILSILKGVMQNADFKAGHVLTSTAKMGNAVVLDGKQLLGDNSDILTLIYMHSAVYTELQKQNAIEYVTDKGPSDSNVRFSTYLGYRVIADDNCPYDSANKVYTTFLLSQGCIARGSGTPVGFTATETGRNRLAGKDYLINRQATVLHPRGMSWTGSGSIAGSTPSNDELAADNWTLATDIKKVGIVAIESKIA